MSITSARFAAPLSVLLAMCTVDASAGLEELSLEELLDIELTVASRRALSARESPGIVTLLTREDLLDAGARDLIDALRLVPGFGFGVDVQGVVGLGVRGLWAHEGKAALFIDGHEMNEGLYSTLQLGNHYPVDLIESIEIIRGPGSAVYGGTAELAVIQVHTRSAAQLDGAAAGVSAGAGSGGLARAVATLEAGSARSGMAWSVKALGGRGPRSLQPYTDIYGTTVELADESALEPTLLMLDLEWQRLHLGWVFDGYHTVQPDQYDAANARGEDTDFNNTSLVLEYRAELGPTLRLTPFVRWRQQRPWEMPGSSSTPFDKRILRWVEGAVLDWNPGPDLSLAAGAEAYQERTTDKGFDPEDGTLFDPDRPGVPVEEVEYTDLALYSQALWLTPVANITAGARWEDHSQTGSAFVPRLAVTRVFDKVHLKLLASRAYRAPGVMNISLNPQIAPEKATVLELETGVRLGGGTQLTANLFDIMIKDPIVYTWEEETETESYRNHARTGSRGLELELRRLGAQGSLTLRWALARARDNQVLSYAVPGGSGRMLGLAEQSASLTLTRELPFRLRAAGTLGWTGPAWALTSLDGNGDAVATESDPALLVNLNLRWHKPLGGTELEATLGVLDLLDASPDFPQPYDGWHAPLPGPGRELRLALRCSGRML